jgi:hypothetical protein
MNETNQGGDGSCVYEGIVVASVVCFLVCVCVCVCVCGASTLGFQRWVDPRVRASTAPSTVSCTKRNEE